MAARGRRTAPKRETAWVRKQTLAAVARIELLTTDEAFCAEQAQMIRMLGQHVISDILESDGLLPWLDRAFCWTDDSALSSMRAAKAFLKS